MNQGGKSAGKTILPLGRQVIRARSLPSRRPFDIAVVFSMIHFFSIVITVTALVSYATQPSEQASKFIGGGVIFIVLSWFAAFFTRRKTFCPLCKGTPLVNSGALTQAKAFRVFPLNHGVTAIFSIIATQKFRCMYCGSDYDLLKPPSHLLVGGKAPDESV